MKPCGHEPPDPSCPRCTLFGSDPVFRRSWGGKELVASDPRNSPCVYLGEVTDRVGCNCPGKWKRRCTLLKREVTIGGDCKSCAEYDAA